MSKEHKKIAYIEPDGCLESPKGKQKKLSEDLIRGF